MYNAFDPFLARPTWHTGHDLDLAAFYKCLASVVCLEGFNPESMGDDFLSKKGTHYADHISNLVSKAWAVHDYLHATNGC